MIKIIYVKFYRAIYYLVILWIKFTLFIKFYLFTEKLISE